MIFLIDHFLSIGVEFLTDFDFHRSLFSHYTQIFEYISGKKKIPEIYSKILGKVLQGFNTTMF